MAEPEKGNSSTGKDKGKMSHLDEDISKDFLTSWKTGGDDMDFTFEPVTKGNKKAFDFGKLDMDFSLDGEFGKLSSFKLDMPDLDFSSSPKKSTKLKEKSEDDSVKENRSAKKNEFTFSFDFNGLDDFSLEAPSTKGRNNPSREKSSEDVDSLNKIECDDLHRQVLKDNGAPEDTIDKRTPSVPEDAPNSKSEDLVNAEGNLDNLPRSPPNSEIVVDPIQPKGTQISSQKILAVNAQEMDHESLLPGKTSNKSYDQGTVHDHDFVPDSRSTSKPIPVKSANTQFASETKLKMNSQGSEKEIQAMEKNSKPSYAELKAKDRSAKPLLAKTSTQANITEVMDVCAATGILNSSPPEACTDTARVPPAAILASDIDKVKPQKLLEQLLTDKPSKKSDEKNELGAVVASSSAAFALDIVDPSTPGVPDTLSSDAKYHTDAPRSTSKFFSASLRRIPGGNYSKSSRLEETNGGAATKLSVLGNTREDTTELGANKRREENGKKLDDNSSSSTKILVYQDSVSEKTEKNAHGDNVSGEIDEDVNVKIRDEVGVNAVSQDGLALKDGFVLQREKKINDPKPSSFQVPSPVSTGQKTKFSNQDPRNLKDKFPSRMPILKSNFSEPNRLSSLRFGKKLPGLPSLKLPGNITTTKHSVSPTMLESAKSGTNLEKGVRSTIPSIGAEKQRPSTPSLKRKPSEAADVGSIKLHPSKRLSPNDNRMAKEVSATEVEDEVHTQGTLLEASRKNIADAHLSSKFDFRQEAKMEELGLVESDANIENAEACAKELEDICSMLKKKHEEAKELLVRALVNNNHLLMLNHPIYEEKIRAVQKFAARVMSKELEAGI